MPSLFGASELASCGEHLPRRHLCMRLMLLSPAFSVQTFFTSGSFICLPAPDTLLAHFLA